MKEKIRKLINAEKGKIKKNYITFIFFIIIAAFMWLINALNKDYIAELSYDVKFINTNDKIIVVSKFPKKIIMTVKTDGFTILKNNLNLNPLPLIIDVNKTFKKSKNKLYFVTNSKRNIFKKINKNNNINIIDIYPDTIFADYTKNISKKFKIYPNVSYKLKQQYFISKVIISPDSLTVTGPKIILDTLSRVESEYLNIGTIDKNIKRNLKIKSVKNLSFDIKRVNINLVIKKFTESKIKIPIDIINLPDSININLIPNNINISYNVALNDFKYVKANDFKIVFDYKKINNNSSFSKIDLVKYPSYIKNIQVSPQQVKYIIYK